MKDRLKFTILLSCSLLFLLCISCYYITSENEFKRNVDLYLAADCVSVDKIRFGLRISSKEKVVWPFEGQLKLMLDGNAEEKPSLTEWSWYSDYEHILPSAPRVHCWYIDKQEMLGWLGDGVHIIQYVYGNVTSNVLRVEISNSGDISFDPTLVGREWFAPDN